MMKREERLSGKAAMVIGGSRGIGAAIARRLAEEGADVAITFANAEARAEEVVADIRAAGRKGLAIRADSADAAALRAAIDKAAVDLGRLDVLVNSAGIISHGAFADYALEDFDRMVAVNVRGVFVAAQEAARHMEAGGRIITIGSVVADRVGFPGSGVYGMTKAAVAGLVRGLAHDLGPRGITINNLQPGPTDTDMTPGDGAVADRVRSLIPVGRLARGEEMAGFVAYLASAEAGFVNGASLTIDGGYLA